MADTKDRLSDLSNSSGGQRKEDSGLIDLDAILRQGAPAEPAAPVTSEPVAATPPPPAAVPVARVTQRSVGVSTPVPASHGYGTADSLDGVASEPARAAAAAASTGPAPVVSAAEAPSVPPPARVSTPAPVPSVTRSAAAPAKGKKRTALTALLLVGVASMAAVFVFRSSQQKSQVAAPVEKPVAVATSETNEAPKPPETTAPAQDGLSLNDLPQADAPAPSAETRHAKPGAHVTTTAAQDKPAAKPEGKTVLTEKDLASTGGDPGDLAGAMKDAVGGGNKDVAAKQAAVETNPNARQLRPPPGQVVGAINAVLPGARACLGPDDPVRNGSIVFANDGAVTRVDLSGSKANDECIKTALSKARVQPFSDESFTTRITVRP